VSLEDPSNTIWFFPLVPASEIECHAAILHIEKQGNVARLRSFYGVHLAVVSFCIALSFGLFVWHSPFVRCFPLHALPHFTVPFTVPFFRFELFASLLLHLCS
jgi:hypothetical protein